MDRTRTRPTKGETTSFRQSTTFGNRDAIAFEPVDTPAQQASGANLPPLARALTMAKKLELDKAVALARRASDLKTPFITELMASGLFNSRELAQFLSVTFATPLLDISAIDSNKILTGVIDNKLMATYKVLAIGKRGNRLFIALADPTDQEALDKIKFQTQLQIEVVVVEYDKLSALVDKATQNASDAISSMAGEDFDFEVQDDTSTALNDSSAEADVDDAPVVRFLQKMLIDAYNARASDLHFEPFETFYRIRFRVDGELREIAQPPIAIKEKLASRIKVISRLDISEKRVPQDGKMKLRIGPDKVLDFRVSTLPTLYGEKIVVRILDSSSAKLGIEALGYEQIEKDRLMEAIKRPYGMVLVTGPTGSGKTVSLYTCLNILNQPGVNIATAEDPAEINLPGINQVNVNEKAGLTFSVALRSFLRQDPDIIMVGEIRDLETADIAIKAAQTGHMVFSTLHTNDAPTTLTRLRNMGVAPFNIASSVILITAQRLARKLCVSCKQPFFIPRENLVEAGFKEEDLDGSWQPYKPVGCDACGGAGYRGRVGIYQVMPITEEIQRIILADGTAVDIADAARRDGVRSLRESGLVKVKMGATSLEEVLAVSNL
jgi:type IV pilus assembly protein PilB